MKFSIITPCYNYGKFLPDAIESVREQVSSANEISVEHIVIDAESTDGSVDFLNECIAQQPQTANYQLSFISEPDKGQTDAINKGLRMATGDVVCWLNADEYYLPGVLNKIAVTFIQNPEVDLVYGEALFVDLDKKFLRVKRDHRFDKKILLYYGCYIQSCSTFWRRRVLDDGHYLDDSYKVTMDFEYWVRLMTLGYSFKFIPQVIAAFMWHENNVSEVFSERRKLERVQVQRKYGLSFMTYPLSRFLFQILRLKHGGLILWRKLTNDFKEPDHD